jgi:hypothetical protein
VLDFGTAHYQNEIRLAQTGALRLGSLKYMSPERRSGDRGDHSCDIYALGLVLIEMLLGRTLAVVPLDARQHDRFIASHIEEIPSLGMPNPEWDAALQEALSRMCAHDPAIRLNATQLLQLLRTFSDQASGSSLDTFAAGPIRELARSLYGDGTQGALTGNRMVVALTGSGSFDTPATRPQQPPEPDLPAEPRPTAEVQFHRPPAREPTRSNHVLVAAVGVIVIAGMGMALLLAVILGFYLLWPDSPAPLTPPVEPAVAQAGLSVHLSARAEDIQWVKLSDADGQQIVRADPQASAMVPPGDYQLSAKVIGHTAVSAPLSLEADADLACAPGEARSVVCTDGEFSVTLLP